MRELGRAIKKGDIWTKASMLVMGAGYFARGQIAKGVIMTGMEVLFFYLWIGVFGSYMGKLNTLGTVQREEIFDPLTLTKTVNDYDNSLQILLFGVIGILLILVFLGLWVSNMKRVYALELQAKRGAHINSFKEDCVALMNEKFHITLLLLPAIGIVLINVIPILFMVCIAFTNYDKDHQPPTYLFQWVGVENFKDLFTTSATITFGYVFVRILVWTLIWAVFATATTYFGGILLAKLINDKMVRFKKLWRTMFVITIAIPQFVTLLLVGKMFGNYGIINELCKNIGLTDWLIGQGLVSEGLTYIPFLTKPGWTHVMIILINIWVGVPFQMLSATGILMNIPVDQLESARIDGANRFQIFWKITMPYMLFVTGPSLITALVSNFNNFNVIYLLTTDYTTGSMEFANSNAKEVDLLITWLFTLTNEKSNFKMASVIGIFVFLICATLTLITFRRMIAGNKEEEFQ